MQTSALLISSSDSMESSTITSKNLNSLPGSWRCIISYLLSLSWRPLSISWAFLLPNVADFTTPSFLFPFLILVFPISFLHLSYLLCSHLISLIYSRLSSLSLPFHLSSLLFSSPLIIAPISVTSLQQPSYRWDLVQCWNFFLAHIWLLSSLLFSSYHSSHLCHKPSTTLLPMRFSTVLKLLLGARLTAQSLISSALLPTSSRCSALSTKRVVVIGGGAAGRFSAIECAKVFSERKSNAKELFNCIFAYFSWQVLRDNVMSLYPLLTGLYFWRVYI